MMRIFGAPGRYIQGPGAIGEIGRVAATLGQRAVLVADPVVLALIGERIARLLEASGVAVTALRCEGEVTKPAVDALARRAAPFRPDLVIAAGGGKGIDAGKAVALRLGTRVVTVPTAASNDAPTSKNLVLYDDAHRLAAVEHLPANPDAVLVDTALIAAAPRALLLGGIGDAVSKKFEAEQCFAADGLNMFGGRSTLAAQVLADACYRVLRRDAEAALAVAGSGAPDAAFERVVEAALLLSGLGFESGGLSVAHALTRGWGAVPGAAAAPHGLQVAFGLLVQLRLERREDGVLEDLLDWYGRLGLPRSLEELGAPGATDAHLTEAARLTLAAPHMRNFPRIVEEAELVLCLRSF